MTDFYYYLRRHSSLFLCKKFDVRVICVDRFNIPKNIFPQFLIHRGVFVMRKA